MEFKAQTSLLSVCPYCSSAVARIGDDITELEILGQVAPLADLGSPLSLGTFGQYRGKQFQLVGQLQLDHGAGPWNEWYAAFDDGTWGWIAEAQGRVYLTTGKEIPGLPPFSRAKVGTRFMVGKLKLSVVEKKRARFVSGSGELPFAVQPGSFFNYVDVQGPEGLFGTIDYGQGDQPEALFLGEELTYDQLFDKSVLRDVAPGEAMGSVGMNCPNCGAGVELKAPDDAMRVTCSACDSLLDCSKGTELYLLSSAKRGGPDPLIPLSSEGWIDGVKYTIYGHLTRSVTFEGVKYMWEEYLLHAAGKGYRWLVCSDNHWTFVEPINAGDVEERGRTVKHQGQSYKHFQSASARVEHLRGEFYWKVEVGERVGTMDFIDPPAMISRELAADEVNWSKGRYLDKKELEKGFKLQRPLPRPFGVAPHMPNLHGKPLKLMLQAAVAFSVLLLLLSGGMAACSDDTKVVEKEFGLSPVNPTAKGPTVVGAMVTTEPFEVEGSSNMVIRVTADVTNSWLHVNGKLVNETMNDVTPFGATVRYHSGYAGGTSWASGARQRTVYVGELSGGRYVMQLIPEWKKGGRAPTRVKVEARNDVFIGSHATTIFFLLWILPILQAARYFAFEKKRWAESDHAGW